MNKEGAGEERVDKEMAAPDAIDHTRAAPREEMRVYVCGGGEREKGGS